ncbi:MAG: HipA domain-containing protein [Desulfobacterales bacterium]|nr:HipA domain-containing protein [Desulfobacterales bacterium]
MNRCPITYEECTGFYSEKGLKSLSRNLADLTPLPYTAAEQVREAAFRASKMSIQGVQPKLSAVLSPAYSEFRIVDINGRFILKPQNPAFPELPENEDLTMRMAGVAGIAVPLHGLIYSKDGSLTYFIKRYDRIGHKKIPQEDFSQLLGLSRRSKYDTSMEKIAKAADMFCSFPAAEKIKLFRLTVFCFLTGNEDMHAKNFSLVTRSGRVEMSPGYDLLNSTIAVRNTKDETALPLKGRKSKLTRSVIAGYYGRERLGIPGKTVEKVLEELERCLPELNRLTEISFLSDQMKEAYVSLLETRAERIF